ncbi:MAG: hypothetical protein ABSG53_19675 [Thermoguttaceae bacterium]
MPIFVSEPATTVRQRSPWPLPKVAYGAIFLMVALAAYGWRLFGSRSLKVDAPPQVTAKVYIHHPNFAFQHIWQEILAQAKTDVRENLYVETRRTGQQTVVAISLSNLPAETLAPIVNVVASAYSQACRAEWKLHLEKAYSVAQAKVQQTERQLFENQTRFELLRDRRIQALANLKPVAPPQPTTIENPRWTEACHRLADLEERRRVLLFERTSLHPSVLEIETRIADVRQEMASIPPKITQEPPAVPPTSVMPPDGPDPAEVQAAQQAVEQVKQNLQQAQAMERAALTARGEELQVDLLAAEAPPPLPAPPHLGTVLVGKALVTATASIVGLGMISLGASLEPVISSIAELQTLLPAPIVGVIPAANPGRRPTSPFRQRLARWGWMAAGLVVLFAVVWLFFGG